jgi:DNA topoisomerase I
MTDGSRALTPVVTKSRAYISPRIMDHYLEGSMVEHYAEQLEEIIAAELEDLTGAEKTLLRLLEQKLRRELRKAA